MAYITKRGNSYSVRYTYEDEHGKSCDKWESFPTKEEATNRKKQIEHELAAGTFLIPSSVTVAEFLMDWLPKQCSKHKWAPKTYESNLSTIQNLIIPYIGSMEMQKLKPYHMENLYTTLSKTPCGSYIEGKKQELTEKQKQRFLSGTTIHEVHRLLGTAFQYAVEWGILVKSPVPVDSPKKSTQERTIWTVEEMRAALDSMEDPILHLAVHLTLVGALREGEIVGLTPEDLDFDAADGIGTFRINKSMQRVRKEALNQVDDGCIIKVFPDKLERSTTSLILKSTKTASSCRTIFMTSALKEELKKWLNQLATDERKDPTRYHDSGMLFRLPNGLAVEPGVLLMELSAYVEDHDFFYPPDPGEKSATIGGNISTNAGGMRAVKYGVTRDYVMGLEVVLPDGTITQFGGKVVKNSSGYDLKDLIIGSEGTLGFITKAILKLLPLPKRVISLLIPFPTLKQAIDTVPVIIKSKTIPTAIEFMQREVIEDAEEYLGKAFPDKQSDAYLLLKFDGNSTQEIEEAYDKVAKLCLEQGALDVLISDTQEREESIWKARGAFLEAIKGSTTYMDEVDMVVPRSRVNEMVTYLHDLHNEIDIRIKSFGHAGDGNLHAYILKDDLSDEEWEKRMSAAMEKIYQKAHELEGQVSGEHGIGYAKKPYLRESLPEKNLDLMNGIKKVFDPKNILNPHKVAQR